MSCETTFASIMFTGSEKKVEKIGPGGIRTVACIWHCLEDTELNH
jgi:hypothetical protein